MSSLRLPFVSLDTRAAPKVVDRATWGAACDELLVREKANLRESDALAAARRRLPMTPVPRDIQVVGPDGPVPLVNAFEGRRCFLRNGEDVYETWWTTGRGTEAMAWSYDLLDRTVYGRQENWEDSPEGWPQPFGVEASQFRTAGRPTIQWSVTDEPVVDGVPHCH